jgi:hypothetical protein
MEKELDRIGKRREKVREALLRLGPMRPGSLTRQYKDPQNQVGSYYQISYTHQMKSHTEYVRPGSVRRLRRETTEFKRFKKLIQEWIDLEIQRSKILSKQE